MRTRRWWMLGVTCLSVIVVALDLTVLNVAVPNISAALHAGIADLQWIIDAYALAFAAVILAAGVIGDRYSRKWVLLAGLAMFLGASVWCALSTSPGELIAARAAMGLGAGVVFPLSLAVVPTAFSDAERPQAIGILTAAVALGLPLGPILGGVLLQYFSWTSVFWINVPAVCITLVAGVVLLPESRNPDAPSVDILGALLSAGSIVGLVWGLMNGEEHGWSAPLTVGLLAGSVVLFTAFVLRVRLAAHPLIDPALLADRRFTWGTAATVAVSVALFALMFLIPQYMQSVVGDDPISSGLRLLPMMGGLLVAGGTAGRLARAAGTRLTVAGGLVLLVAGLVVLSRVHLSTGYGIVAIGLVLSGLGTGSAIAAAMDSVMAAAGGDEAGVGASLNSALRQVGGAIAVAAFGSVLSTSYAHALRPSLAALPADEAAIARGSISQAAQLAAQLGDGPGAALREAAGRAFLHGMSIVMLICAAVAVVSALTSFLYLPGRTTGAKVASAQAPATPEEDTRTQAEKDSGAPAEHTEAQVREVETNTEDASAQH